MDDLGTEGDTRRLTTKEIDALADDIAVRAATIASATFALLEKIREFDRAKGWARQGAKDCASWLSWRTGVGRTAAKQQVQVANRLPDFPLVAEAFRKGELSYTKVRAVTREGMPPDKDEILLHQARGATGAQLERISAAYRRHAPEKSLLDEESRYVRKSFHRDGTVSVAIRVLPDEAERIYQAIGEMKRKLVEEARPEEARADEASHSAESPTADDAPEWPTPTMADAAVAMVEQHCARIDDETPSQPAAEKRHLLIHLREERICGDEAWTAELHDGTPIIGDSLKRLACDCGLVAAKTDEQGDPLALGRLKRAVSASLRRALLMRDRCCQFPGCAQLAMLEAHHIEHWFDLGPTDKDNLTLVCAFHHQRLHEGGFSAKRHEDGSLAIFDPDGRPLERTPTPPTLTNSGARILQRECAANDIAINPRTNLVNDNGVGLDLGMAVDALLPLEHHTCRRCEQHRWNYPRAHTGHDKCHVEFVSHVCTTSRPSAAGV